MKSFKNFYFPLIILIATILGILYGIFLGDYVAIVKPLGTIFTRLLFMLVPGLIFFSLASSLANIGSVELLGKTGGKVIGWFLLTTIIGAIIGIIYGLIFKPGQVLTFSDNTEIEEAEFSLQNFIEWIPDNAFAALTDGDIIQIVVLAIIVGLAVILTNKGEDKTLLSKFLNAGQTLFINITKYVMYFAPIGIFGLIANSLHQLKDNSLKT